MTTAALWLAININLLAEPVRTEPVDPPTELPTLTVEGQRELPPPESWRYAKADGLEVLANTSDRATKRFVREFYLFRSLIEIVYPAVAGASGDAPTTILLCGRGNSFDQFFPRQAGETSEENWQLREHTAGRVLETADRVVFVVNAYSGDIELNAPGAMPEEGDADPADKVAADPLAGINRVYFRHLFKKALKTPPNWLVEGFSGLLAASERTTEGGIAIGKVGNDAGGRKYGDFLTTFGVTGGGMPPLGKLFGSDWSTRIEDYNRLSQYAYLFVHMNMMEARGKFQPRFIAFAQEACREPVTEVMFQRHFGMTFKQAEKKMWSYLQETSFKHQRLNLPKGQTVPAPPVIEMRAATDGEVGRLKGDVFFGIGEFGLARTAMIAPYIRGERDAELLAGLGLTQLEINEPEKARKFLEAAWQAKCARPAGLVALARLRLEEARAKPGAPGGRLSKRQVLDVLTLLFAAREQAPLKPELYVLIAQAWCDSAQTPTTANLEVVAEGVNRFPHNIPLVLAAADVYAKHGFVSEATVLAEGGLKISKDDAVTKKQFSEMLASLKSP